MDPIKVIRTLQSTLVKYLSSNNLTMHRGKVINFKKKGLMFGSSQWASQFIIAINVVDSLWPSSLADCGRL